MKSENLRQLDLRDNKISAIHPKAFVNLHNLTLLDLGSNTCVNEMFQNPDITVLDMVYVQERLQNCFSNFPKQNLVCNFTSIGLKYICYIRNVNIEKDEDVNITGNHQPGKSNSDVSSVIFIESKLHGIPSEIFSQFENLKELNVESTELEELNHLENCGSLETFRAPFNNIVKITDETFKDCKNLRTVDLQSNKIEKLGKTVFKHNKKLWEVNLSRNEVSGIEPCGFLGNQPELQSVNFLGNRCVHHDIQIVNGNFADLEKKLIPCYMAWYSEILATP
jgi:Leucine-rich repeat (LRR) protein